MTRDDLVAAFTRRPVPYDDLGPGLALMPLDVADMVAVREWEKARGDGTGYHLMFVRALRTEAGDRVFPDDADAATVVAAFVGGAIDAVAARVQEISRLGGGAAGKSPFDDRPDVLFLFRLALALRKTVAEVLTGQPGPMSAAEFELWRDFYTRVGFDADRIEWGAAAGAAYVGGAWGGKAKAADLIPAFGPPAPRRTNGPLLLAYLAAVPGARVYHHGGR